jgi:adenosylcobinamide-GDP ribazoletransferase
MVKFFHSFLLALGFFSRIPVPSKPDFKPADMAGISAFFPLVGWIISLGMVLVYLGLHLLLPPSISMIGMLAAGIWLTGALHEDGLADTADGLGGGFEREHVLTIMHDSRVGSYGVLALTIILLLKFTALSAMSASVMLWVVVAGHSVSRLAGVMLMQTLAYVRPQGKGGSMTQPLGKPALAFAIFTGLLPLLGAFWFIHLVFLPLILLAVALVWWWFRATLKRRLGGYTGDCVGAMQQLTEITFYLGVLACLSQ